MVARCFLFSYQKYQFGSILEGLGMGSVGIFYDYLEHFTAIWCILWPFGKVYGHLVHFFLFGMFGPIKIWQPWFRVFYFGKKCPEAPQQQA
jgi:hypothetical protein